MTHRIMSEYDPDIEGILRHSHDAEHALTEKTDISGSDREEEMAVVLKVRAVQAALFGRTELSNQSLQRLSEMAASSRDNAIQQANEGAIGGVLWAQKKFAEAIPHLQEDQANPLSAARLLLAAREVGDTQLADQVANDLNNYHEATMDDLLARRLLNAQARK